MQKKDNEVVSVFGFSVVKILSGSMIDAGFNIGDFIIKSINTDKLRIGDDIAFYRFLDTKDPSQSRLTKIEDFENLPEITSEDRVCGNKTKKDAIERKADIIFHRIIGVYMAEDGTRFFETQGVSNSDPDPFLIREEFVVGKNVVNSRALMDMLSFCSSTFGMIVIVIVPLSVLIFFQLMEIFDIVIAISYEKKVLSFSVPFDDEECIKLQIGKDMDDFDKIYFYDVTQRKKKEQVKEFLWGCLQDNNATKKDKKYLDSVNLSLEEYKKGRENYWTFWLNFYGKKGKNKLTKLKNKADLILQSTASIYGLKKLLEKGPLKNKFSSKHELKLKTKKKVCLKRLKSSLG